MSRDDVDRLRSRRVAGTAPILLAYLCTKLFSDLPPPVVLSPKPKLTAEERHTRQADRLATIRLRMLISRELEERGIIIPTEIPNALGMPAAEAVKLMTGRQWHPDTVARLEAAAARLGLPHR